MDELLRGPALDREGAAADLARAVAFLHAFARRRATGLVPVPGGFAVLNERYPGSYDDNKLIVTTAPGGAPALLAAAGEVLEGRAHRLVCVDDDRLGTDLAPAFADAGYDHETNLIMAFRGRIPDDAPPAERLTLEELVPVLRHDWRQTLPDAPDEAVEDLARRIEARLRGAASVTFWGTRASGGEIAARADLYAEGAVAQIESVFTRDPYRGQGHARTLVRALLAEAAAAELIFLVADAADWPRHFYARLGFEAVGRTHAFLRA